MLDLLQEYRLLADEIIFLPRFGAGEGHVRHGEKEPNAAIVPIVEFAGVHHQVSRLRSLPGEIDFVGGYFSASRSGSPQQ